MNTTFNPPKYRITKPVRLIELFAGIGSQSKALEKLGVDFVPWKVCEFDKYAVASYNAVHGTNFETSDVSKIKGEDLEIVDTDKYDYIMTYSFPCTDLSLAGRRAGMDRNSGTRSSLLWQVERLLTETKELPQILVMENVPQVHSASNMEAFQDWLSFLQSKGYSSYYKDLAANDYGVPQKRMRCIMVSVLGDYMYKFPKPLDKISKLDDYLDKIPDPKFYINNKKSKELIDNIIVDKVKLHKGVNSVIIKGMAGDKYRAECKPTDISCTLCARDWKGFNNYGQTGIIEMDGEVPTTDNIKVRRLSTVESWKLMGFTEEDVRKAEKVNSNTQLLKQAGNSIVVDVLVNVFKELF